MAKGGSDRARFAAEPASPPPESTPVAWPPGRLDTGGSGVSPASTWPPVRGKIFS